jgi:DNA-binding NtrC family response regulator
VFLLSFVGMSRLKSDGAVSSSATIFVVDDEQMLLDLAEMILEQAGFKVCLFHDPQKALSAYIAAKPAPDVLVTDYAMAKMSGMDLIRECKRLNPRQKTILLSGTVDESVYADSPIKPDYLMTKPYQIHKLVEMIHSLVAS